MPPRGPSEHCARGRAARTGFPGRDLDADPELTSLEPPIGDTGGVRGPPGFGEASGVTPRLRAAPPRRGGGRVRDSRSGVAAASGGVGPGGSGRPRRAPAAEAARGIPTR